MYGGYNQPPNQENFYTRPPPPFGQYPHSAPQSHGYYGAPNFQRDMGQQYRPQEPSSMNEAAGSFLLATPHGVMSTWPPQYGGQQPAVQQPGMGAAPPMYPGQQQFVHLGFNPYYQQVGSMYQHPPPQGYPQQPGLPVPYGMPLRPYMPQANICETAYQVEEGNPVSECGAAMNNLSLAAVPNFQPRTQTVRNNRGYQGRRMRTYQERFGEDRADMYNADVLSRLPSVSAPNLFEATEEKDSVDSAISELPKMISTVEPFERTQSDANLISGKVDDLQKNRLSFRHKRASQRNFASVDSSASTAAATVPSSGYHSGSALTVTSRQSVTEDHDRTLVEEMPMAGSSSSPNEPDISSACLMPEGLDGPEDLKGITFGWSPPTSTP